MLLRGVLIRVDDPVAVDLLSEGVEGSEEVVGDRNLPHRSLQLLPPGHLLGALDDDVLTASGGVNNATPVAEP